MSWIAATDPLALLAIQSGQVGAPTQSTAPQNATDLTAAQRFVQIGEPVPVVFARFRNNKGGILVSPGATEARFQNDANNNTTFYYHLAISEGSIASIPVKDVFQGLSRVGSHTQTYSRRAGTWTPGNFITPSAVAAVQFTFDDLAVPVDSRVWYNATYVNGVWRFIYNGTDYTFGTGVNGVRNTIGADLPLAVAPYFCGTVGAYPGISTLSFAHTTPNASDLYRQQVHLFIRGGIYVTRIYDSVVGPSDNFADLVKWLLLNTARVPAALLDNTALLKAATFLEYNSFTCNCEIKNSLNYSDFVTKWAPYFLLGQSSNNGKRGLRPLLPTTSAGAIITTAVTPEYVFTETDVIAGSLEIDYIPLADRLPFVVQVIWRQQIESDTGVIRTAELRFTDTADVGPYEAHDLSEFCTNEDHAVKVGTYILAKRVYVTHTVRFTARPQAHTTTIGAGDIVALTMPRNPTSYAASVHSHLYQIERINKTLAGDVTYEATHFPVDDAQRSLVALAVANASGTGIILTSNRTGANLDFNSSSDNTIPTEEFTEVAFEDPTDIGSIGNEGAVGALPGNESDLGDAESLGPFITPPVPGGAAGVPPAGICSGARIFLTVTNLQNNKTWKSEVDTWSLSLTPPASLGLSDWNNTAIDYSFVCPDGTNGKLPTYTWSGWADQVGAKSLPPDNYTITRTSTIIIVGVSCTSGAITRDETFTLSGGSSSHINIKSVEMLTSAQTSGTSPCGSASNATAAGHSYKVTFANDTTQTRSWGGAATGSDTNTTTGITVLHNIAISYTTSGQPIYPPISLKV